MRKTILIISTIIFLTAGILPNKGITQNEMTVLLEETLSKEDSKEKVDELIRLATIYRNINFDTVLIICDLALELSENLNYNKGKAESFHKRSLAYGATGKTMKAIEYTREALNYAEQMNDTVLIAKYNYTIANLKKNTRDNMEALRHYHIALDLFFNIGDTAKAAIVYSGIGNYFLLISLFDSAAIYYHKYLDLTDPSTNNLSIAKVHSNLGKVYRLLNEYENSRKYLDLAYKPIMESNSWSEKGNLYSKMGSLDIEMGDNVKARQNFRLADSIYRKHGDTLGVSHCNINLSIILRQQGEFENSIAMLNSALKYYRQNEHTEGIIVAWMGIAETFYLNEKYKDALVYYDSAYNLAKETNNLRRQEEILSDKLTLYTDLGNWEKATNILVEIHEIGDSIYNFNKTITVNELRVKYNRDRDQLDLLTKENIILKTTKQRDIFLFTGLGFILLAAYLFIFFRYRARKNQIIAEQKIQQLEEEKKLMAARFLVEGQENERKRIASAIHDSLGVLLSTSKMHITAIKDDNPENRALIDKATRFLDEANTEMRKISHNMMPGALSKLGLCEALEDLFENLDETEGIDARMEVLGPKERLPENQEIMIYRVVQEMVNNTLKHSKADRIDLTLVIHPDELDLSYSDNGRGFDMEEVLAKKTMGIQSIRSRVKFLDGIIKIDSSPGKGVVYRISVPVDTNKGLTSV